MRLLLVNVNLPCRFRYSGVGYSRLNFNSFFAVQLPTSPRRARRISSRTYASAAAPFTEETVQVPVGGNGYVSLSVLHPARVAATTESAQPNVILYLPPGPVFTQRDVKKGSDGKAGENNGLNGGGAGSEEGQLLSPTPQHVLASTTSSTVVTLNYRLGYMPSSFAEGEGQAVSTQSPSPQKQRFYKYPTPVHDTLAGFDWILQELQPAHLCVFGTHIGGSLAVMLALTEARDVRAIAAYEPICDWTELDEYCTIAPEDLEQALSPTATKGRRKTEEVELLQAQIAQIMKKTKRWRKGPTPADLVPLLNARERFFETPTNYFDSFASPMIFLRSPGKDAPKIFPKYRTGPEHPVPVLKKPELAEDLTDFWNIYIVPDEEVEVADNTSEDEERPLRRRKALLRWPPYGLDYGVTGPSWANYGIKRLQVTLPWVRLFASGDVTVREDIETGTEANPSSVDGEVETTPRRRRSSNKDTVLARQAEKMVSVMRRACFWGRERGHGERKVTLTWMPKISPTAGDEPSTKELTVLKRPEHAVAEEAGQWFREIMEDKLQA
ncbi:hypothetical protein VTN77DRAFT_3674 [Rasamsonia byssochlamydoides]|uniref:uncharacterized protein n=1 Tax=Rasamsonia byssochlamydoides TaxID=89139 RepID=UPI0037449D5C